MTNPGQRFQIDLSNVDEEDAFRPKAGLGSIAGLSTASLVRDIIERRSSSISTALPRPPEASEKKSESGFPAHKKRTRFSAFKTQNPILKVNRVGGQKKDGVSQASGGRGTGVDELDRRRIDEENKDRLAKMSDEEIEREKQELLEGLSPSLVQRLLRRASFGAAENVDTNKEQASAGHSAEASPSVNLLSSSSSSGRESIFRSQTNSADESPGQAPSDVSYQPPDAARETPSSLQPTTILPPTPKIHFPAPPSTSDPPPFLDPSSPDFLTQLHSKYFPSLPADPSKLAWMAPTATDDSESPYSPNLPSLPPSAIRFDFRGVLLPPRTARAIPVSKGLHHHGDAPEAAGYTIPELARLARSAFPAQRSMAFQTLGRILYRLGKGFYGDEGSELTMGLWRCVEEGAVLDTLTEEVGRERGHLTCKTLATEALWLWQRGGGKRWKAT